MKLKEIDRTAIQAWSPAEHHPIYLAAGTSAQQLDATFSTSASLEIFELDLAELTLDMKLCGTFSSSQRYHKLVWGPYGMNEQGLPSGVLIAGGENGNVILYDPAKIMAGDSEVVIAQNDKHSGPVRALDVNSFQTNLVVSGGNESEIYIWDLNNFSSPMTPGPKTQPLEDISCVAWNRQVQHILASASPSGRASVWDLRKNDLIIKVSDHSNRMHCSGLAWNPEVATQLVLASEDDRMPVIQVWDLRFATSPLKVLENHTRGVLAIAWSLADPELLLSCGKDNRILCWNPNTAEVLYELPTSTQWCFDIQWCPRNPALLSAAAFDGHISVYSIMGGSNDCQSQKQADQISTSFGNLDPFGMGQTLPPLQLPQSSAPPSTVAPLKKPPRWIRRPVGASFAFGGKLVTLENVKATPQQPQQPSHPVVHVSQVVTETTFLNRSSQLQAAMAAGSFVEFCQSKIDAAQNEFERTVWSFLKVNFENDTRGKYLELLGYNKEELALKITEALQKEDKPEEPISTRDAEPELKPGPQPVPWAVTKLEPESDLNPPTELSPEPEIELQLESKPDLNAQGDPLPDPELDLKPQVDLQPKPELGHQPEPEFDPKPMVDLPEPQFDLRDEPETELEVDLKSEQINASTDATPQEEEEEEEVDLDEIGAIEAEVENAALEDIPTAAKEAIKLRVSEDVDGLITQALLTGDFEGAVDLCVHDNRMADSIILAIAGGPELLEKTQKKYFSKSPSRITKLISAVVTRNWQEILETCDLQNWKEALAAVMTYARTEEFSNLCDLLGSRLESDGDLELQAQACLCYICAGNVEKLVACWSKAQDDYSPLSLQDLVEKVVVLQRAVQQTQKGHSAVVGCLLANKMSHYAELLASQGSLVTALAYLPDNTQQAAVQPLQERLRKALGEPSAAPAAPGLATGARPAAVGKTPAGPTYTPEQPSHAPQPAPQPAPSAARVPVPQYYQQVRSASTITSWSNQTPTSLPSIPPPVGPASELQQTEPPPPGFVMQQPPSSGVPAPTATGYMYSQQYPQTYPQVQQYTPGVGGPSIYQPQQYIAPAPPPPTSSSTGVYPQYMHPAPSHPMPQVFPGSHQGAPVGPTLPQSSSYSPSPLSPGASFQHSGPGAPASYPPPPPTGPTGTQPDLTLVPASQRTGGADDPDTSGVLEGPQNGWNDPPSLTRVSKKKKAPEHYTPPAPITAPIMGPLGEAQAQAPSTMQPQQHSMGQPGIQPPYSGLQQAQNVPPRHPGVPNMNVEGAPGAPIGDVIQPMQTIPTEKITKKPIPDEHLILKTTFEGLIQRCLAAATDPQTKRKLDDANKRLEFLYDKLREQTLSPPIVGGLHNIARSIESRCYTDGLNIHTHIVSNSNFSETSAFMPVLKVVLTQANKLGV